MTDPILEVCCGDIDSVLAAAEGGAARVELCCGLAEGGFTPSAALIEAAVQCGIKVNVLIRPRGGDFLYSRREKDMMLRDAGFAAGAGANGIVCGALLSDGSVDTAFCRELAQCCSATELTFHRAFDLCADPLKALDAIADLGFSRILTSGLAPNALEGAPMLARLSDYAGGRIRILAGGGVNPGNAARILSLGKADELHASARAAIASDMEYRRAGVSMGVAGADEYSRLSTSAEIVRQIVNAMKSTI
ncbi:MAG: copper homeostasis protein CutC [Muribaculaceae bacterium]|nr:copper homeostasis protein CutC [Muribaculaceae bacterium]